MVYNCELYYTYVTIRVGLPTVPRITPRYKETVLGPKGVAADCLLNAVIAS